MQHEQYTEFVDPGFSVADSEGNELDASNVKVSGVFDITRAGTYELLYTFQDENQIPADPITRTVTVVDTQAPSITLVGEAEIEHEQGQEFVDPGATLDEDPEGELFVVSTAQLPSQGLWMHLDANRITDANPEMFFFAGLTYPGKATISLTCVVNRSLSLMRSTVCLQFAWMEMILLRLQKMFSADTRYSMCRDGPAASQDA